PKHHEAAVGRDRGTRGVSKQRLRARGGDAHLRERRELAVANEDAGGVRVRDERGRTARERHVATIGGDGGSARVVVARRAPCAPPVATLTRSVVPFRRSRTKTSKTPFVSPGTRLVAPLVNAT